MKKWLFPLGLALIGLAWGCSDDDGGQNPPPDETDLTLNFRATYGGAPLVMATDTTEAYAYEDGMEALFLTFQFYISHVTLLQADGASVEVLPVELVAFNDLQTEAEAQQGVAVKIEDVPTGAYSGIRFWLGVDTVINRTMRPQNFQIGHPLTQNYWSWATGYIYASIEGRADLGDGAGFSGISYHAGNDDTFYREMTFDQALDLNNAEGGAVDFKVDLRRVLVGDSGAYLDFRQHPVLHAEKDGYFKFIIDGLERSITLE